MFHDSLELLGAAALPIVLLCVGANIRLQGLEASVLPTLISVAGKLVVFPAVILLAALALELSPLETLVALVFGAVPTAASSYTLARQMGGDAPLMAAIITIQTALSFVTLPLTLALAERLLQ